MMLVCGHAIGAGPTTSATTNIVRIATITERSAAFVTGIPKSNVHPIQPPSAAGAQALTVLDDHSVSKFRLCAQSLAREELFDQHAPVGFDHAPRTQIVGAGGDFDVAQTLSSDFLQQLAKRARCVTAALVMALLEALA
ncbi:MAG TPA: hypothetical protein VL693_14145 [Vicinamibacterales bacterium]|jgi:hypothetical protein|nr:hypothetical protein [Vicinamibacterales bacterium]